MSVTRFLVLLGVVFCSCGTGKMFIKNGITDQQAQKDRYECMRENTFQSRSASVWGSLGTSSSGHKLNHELYEACMFGRGYRWADK